MADYKSMDLTQLKAARKSLIDSGKELSTSKELGKVENLIKTLEPNKYDTKQVSSAYKQLSSGVTETGGWTEKNLDNIEKYTGSRPQLQSPTASGAAGGDLSVALSGYQDSVFGASNNVELRESIVNQLEPDMEKPELLNRVEEYEKMRGEMGVADLETTLTDLKAQLEEQYAAKRARTTDAQGKPVAMGVIAGRVSEIERQENERIDAIGRQLNVINDQLTTAYNTIEQYMNFMSLDYQDAVTQYNTEFNRNLQIYHLVDAEIDEQVSTARANLQTYQNAIINGNMSYSQLSSDQKTFINKLEVQAGLPVGFTSRLNPDDKVIYNGTRESGGVKYVDYITQNPDGSLNTKSVAVGSSSGGSGGTEREQLGDATSQMREAITTAASEAKQMGVSFEGAGAKSYITINQARPLIQAWEDAGYSSDSWWDKFESYVYGGKQ